MQDVKAKLQDSYKALQLLARQQQSIPLAQQQWLIAVLAEQAEFLHQPKQARAWLEQLLFAAQSELAPLPLWVKWADLTLKQDATLVYQKLQHLHQHQQLEDALLLRLALAEQQLAEGQEYQVLMQQRVSLREQRQDTLHSADLAHYYLRLAPDPKKALYYAGLNVQQAQEPDDQLLFTLALKQSQQDTSPQSKQENNHEMVCSHMLMFKLLCLCTQFKHRLYATTKYRGRVIRHTGTEYCRLTTGIELACGSGYSLE